MRLWMQSPREEKTDAALLFSSTWAANMVANFGSVVMVPTVVRTGKGKFAATASEVAVVVLSVVSKN
jgi:hypothetical protein